MYTLIQLTIYITNDVAMKKRICLLVLLFILIILVALLTYFRFFYYDTKNNDLNNSNNEDIIYLSYRRETFDDSGELVDYSNNSNYQIHYDDSKMTICTVVPDVCDSFDYYKNDDQYVMVTNNEKLINANLEIKDDVNKEFGNIIKIIKTYDDEDGGYSIFYFKKREESGD